MLRLIFLNLLALFGYQVEPAPARLGKKLTTREKINKWVRKHEYELLIVIIFLMMVLFVLAIFMFVPPMDVWNNHFNEVI